MALVNPGAATKYFACPTALNNVQANYLTIFAFYRLQTGFANNFSLAQLGNTPLGDLNQVGIAAGKVTAMWHNAAGGSGTAAGPAQPSDQAWHTAAGAFTQAHFAVSADAASYVSGSANGAVAFTQAVIGAGGWAYNNATSTAAQIAEVSIWQGELSTVSLDALSSGMSPWQVARQTTCELAHYFPLRTDLLDYGPLKNNGLVAFGGAKAVFTGHPPVMPAIRPIKYFHVPAGTVSTTVTPGKGSEVITGQMPVVNIGVTVTPGKGQATIAGHAPAVTAFGQAIVSPLAGALSVKGFVPHLIGQPYTPPVLGAGDDSVPLHWRKRDPHMQPVFSPVLRRKVSEPQPADAVEAPNTGDDLYKDAEQRATMLKALDEHISTLRHEAAARGLSRMARDAGRKQAADRVRQASEQARSHAARAADIARRLAAGRLLDGDE